MTPKNTKEEKALTGRRRYIFLLSHPIQYFAPLFAFLTKKGLSPIVWYCTGEEDKKYDTEFGRSLQWDIPLLEGYEYQFLENRPLRPVASKSFLSLFNPGIVTRLFRQEKSTLVIHSWQYATDWLAIIFGKLAGHRIALWTEINAAHEASQPGRKKLLKRIFLKTLLLFVSECWCIGTRNRELYLSLGISPSRLRNTPYSVDNDRFRAVALQTSKVAARKALSLPQEGFILLYSGKYISKKRPLDLLQAFCDAQIPNATLVMVGEGGLRPQMEQFIAEKALTGRVILTGFVNQSAIPLYYRAADLFVMCSGVGETWGLSVNEAMNFGLPLLVSSLTGSSADLVAKGKNGYVFDTGDITTLANRIRQIALLPGEELAAMGNHSLARIQRNSYQTIYEGIIA